MQLFNRLMYKRNSKVLVDDVIYEIDEQGFVEVSDEHAAILLKNEAWDKVSGKKDQQPKVKKTTVLLTNSDEPVAGQVALEPATAADENPWPDPTPDMDIEYLREMATAYEVTYSDKAKADKLVKDILKAMYPEE